MSGWNGIFYNGIFHCGFDMLTSSSLQLVMINSGGSIVSTNARFGDGQIWQAGGGSNGFTFGVNLARVIIGQYIYLSGLPSSGWGQLFWWIDTVSGNTQLNLSVGPAGQLQFFSGSSTTTPIGSASPNGTIASNRGAYIQTDVTIGTSTGIVKCYVDTSGTSAVISATSVNTQTSGNAWVNQYSFPHGGLIGISFYLDDFYALDLTGSAPFNAILGPVHEHWDVPTSDSGTNQFSTSPSQTTGHHYLNIDSVTTPSGSAYNYSNTVGQEELYSFPALSNVTTVFAVTEWLYTELDSAGTRTVSPVLVSNSIAQVGAAYTPASTLAYNYQPSTIDPNTGNAWSAGTVAAAGNVELGIEVIS